ncbi:hypothetical protein PMAYCL1PPCAC_01816, partial [Pristionchus mayeri]
TVDSIVAPLEMEGEGSETMIVQPAEEPAGSVEEEAAPSAVLSSDSSPSKMEELGRGIGDSESGSIGMQKQPEPKHDQKVSSEPRMEEEEDQERLERGDQLRARIKEEGEVNDKDTLYLLDYAPLR